MRFSYATLTVSLPVEGVLSVAMNRPEAANALNAAMGKEISQLFQSLPECGAVVLTGSGRAFCAGADLKERHGMDEAQWEAQHRHLRAARDAVLHSPVPVIAAVNGAAYGGGLELALACDFRYAAAAARLAFSEVKLGIMPGLGGAQFFARAAGSGCALEWLLTGKPFTAEEAAGMGLVNRVLTADLLMKEALATAATIRDNAPLAVAAIRRAVREGDGAPLEEALEREREFYQALLSTKDRHEGINAFNQKRKPVFTGE